MQLEPKNIVEEVPKKLGTLQNMIKDDNTYMEEDTYEILKEIANFRNVVSVNLKELVDKIGREDIVETFQRLTIAAEMDVLNDMNHRLNEMLKTATNLAEISALGAIAAYLELKHRKKEVDIIDRKEMIKLELDDDKKEVLKIFKRYVKKDWGWFKERFGIEDSGMIKRMLENRGIIEQGMVIVTELQLYKAIKENDEKMIRKLLKKYARLTDNRLMMKLLKDRTNTKDIVWLFKGIFKILKIM